MNLDQQEKLRQEAIKIAEKTFPYKGTQGLHHQAVRKLIVEGILCYVHSVEGRLFGNLK